MSQTCPTKQKSHRKIIIILMTVVVGMFGFAFALVPLYNAFCEATGIQGKGNTGRTRVASFDGVDQTRTVTIEFTTHVKSDMPWSFEPIVKNVTVHPGQMKTVSFKAKNLASRTITGQAIPSTTPGYAGLHLQKTECFCFEQQTLAAGEEVEMPLIFFIDRDLPKDVKRMTLSYALFEATNT